MSAPGTRDDRIESREEEILAELAARLETADVSSTDADLVRRVLAAMNPGQPAVGCDSWPAMSPSPARSRDRHSNGE